jgi:hypothetical protein
MITTCLIYFPLTAFIDVALEGGANDELPFDPEHALSATTMPAITSGRKRSIESTFLRKKFYPV